MCWVLNFPVVLSLWKASKLHGLPFLDSEIVWYRHQKGAETLYVLSHIKGCRIFKFDFHVLFVFLCKFLFFFQIFSFTFHGLFGYARKNQRTLGSCARAPGNSWGMQNSVKHSTKASKPRRNGSLMQTQRDMRNPFLHNKEFSSFSNNHSFFLPAYAEMIEKAGVQLSQVFLHVPFGHPLVQYLRRSLIIQASPK